MRRFILFPMLVSVMAVSAYADDLDSQLDAITSRLGNDPDIQKPAPSSKVEVPDEVSALVPATRAATQGEGDNAGLPAMQPEQVPVRKWQPDYSRRDVEYLGQWVPVFVGENFATPVTFPKPIATLNIIHGDQIGLSSKFQPGFTQYVFIPRGPNVNTQCIAEAKDGTKYNLLFLDGNQQSAHGRIDAGGVLLVERREGPKEGVDIDAITEWEKYGAGSIAMRHRIERLIIAMHKKLPVSGYKVLNFKGKVVAEDPMFRIHLVRVWHKPSQKHPLDGIEYWFYNKIDRPIALIPQLVKKALHVDGDFAIQYERDTIMPHDYQRILVAYMLPEGKKPLEEVPVDLNLMLEDMNSETRNMQHDNGLEDEG